MAAMSAVIGFLLACTLLIPAVIGIYVWRDASRRDMNPILWTVVSAAAPACSGLLIYLLVRGRSGLLECPVCKAEVKGQDTACPSCGAVFRPTCASCGCPLQENWTVCPVCAMPFEQSHIERVVPIRRKDRVLRKLLLFLLLVPVVFFLLLLIVNLSVSETYRFSSGMSSYTEEDMAHYREMPGVWEWLEESRQKDPEGIYVLRWREETEEGKKTVYLIYRPSAGYMRTVNNHMRDGWFQDVEEISFEDTDDPAWDHAYFPLTCVTDQCSEYTGLAVFVNGEQVPYERKDIDFDPTLDKYWIHTEE